MRWGSWLPCSSETTAIATLIPLHSAPAAAKNLGCKLLFPFLSQLQPSLGTTCMVAPGTLLRRTPSSPSPQTAQTCSSVYTRAPAIATSPSPSTLFFLGGNERRRHDVSPQGPSSPVLPQPPQNRCLIKTILPLAHTHGLYT